MCSVPIIVFTYKIVKFYFRVFHYLYYYFVLSVIVFLLNKCLILTKTCFEKLLKKIYLFLYVKWYSSKFTGRNFSTRSPHKTRKKHLPNMLSIFKISSMHSVCKISHPRHSTGIFCENIRNFYHFIFSACLFSKL